VGSSPTKGTKFKAMNEARIVMTIKREKEFTNEEISEIMQDIKGRLQGYYTKCPESLKNVEIVIGYEKAN
jgi:hypothetical protein